ncbi:MAG: energy-coupling factor ABC transporter ATP-binding protein [Fischerella sp.]|nr:energy-coupling factor ABC transporter ATP-binding protein [Fischerella sp.]
MSEWLLTFEQVCYTYSGAKQPAVNGLTIKIPAQKKCGLIGQNGCGKTTLFLLANGLYKPQKGTIYWQGKPLQYDRKFLRDLRQKIGVVFQDPEQQLVASTVEEDISYGLCNLGLPEAEMQQRIEQVLVDFDLTSLVQTPVHHLSLGQKKRVSIADVMVLKPELLLLDEPTAYLDRLNTRHLMKTLKNIHAGGTTIVIATHDLDLVYRWADWVFVMDRGRLVLEGNPQDVFTQRDILEELQLGVPLIYEMLCAADEFAEERAVLERLRQRMLNVFREF